MANGYLTALDEFFCAHYSDYVKICALEGYQTPDLISVGADGNIVRRDSELMRLCHQPNQAELLEKFKAGLTDIYFSFNFSFIPFGDRIKDVFRKYTFAKILPAVLERNHETVQSAGQKLSIEPRFWQKIAKGKLYPEKNLVLALALVCRLNKRDAENLLAVCGFSLSDDSVRDLVAAYLIEQKIYNREMRNACLREYGITNLPIAESS